MKNRTKSYKIGLEEVDMGKAYFSSWNSFYADYRICQRLSRQFDI